MEEELFTLNDTGKSIWDMLDGQRTVNDIVKELASEFETEGEELEVDVLGLLEELVSRKLVVAV
jgi:coenzyme PQQ biosynthesis protein PqqD